jgi:hypothetical protein
MPLTAIHHENGIFALQGEGQADLVVIGSLHHRAWTAEQIKEVEQSSDEAATGDDKKNKKKVVKIHLGPLPPPPHPLGIVVPGTPDDVLKSGNQVFPMSLDRAFEANGHLAPGVVERIKQHASSIGENSMLHVQAYLPPNFSVDLSALGRHASVLGGKVGHPITMWVGGRKPDELDR